MSAGRGIDTSSLRMIIKPRANPVPRRPCASVLSLRTLPLEKIQRVVKRRTLFRFGRQPRLTPGQPPPGSIVVAKTKRGSRRRLPRIHQKDASCPPTEASESLLPPLAPNPKLRARRTDLLPPFNHVTPPFLCAWLRAGR